MPAGTDTQEQVVLASAFGLVCDGGASPAQQAGNTKALVAAGAEAARRHRSVLLPLGTCRFKPFTVPAGVKVAGAGQGRTILEVSASTGGANAVTLSDNSSLQDLTIDGDKAEQTVGACGVFGGKIRDATIEDVTVTNVLGMGDCFQDSANISHVRETVTHTQRPSLLTHTDANGKNGSGFWTASYTQSSFFYDGGSQYIDCVATDNDLDGLEFGSNNITIRGGTYAHNGLFTDQTEADRSTAVHTKILGGALGAAGIYFAPGDGKPGSSPTVGLNTVIMGLRAYRNTESGFDLGLGRGSTVAENIAFENGTLGFNLDGYSGAGFYTLTRNEAFDNGRTTFKGWQRANPGYELQAGFSFTGRQSHVTIVDNTAFDHRGASGTQRWGMYLQGGITTLGPPAFDHFKLAGNRLAGNSAGASNFSGVGAPLPAEVTNLDLAP